MTVTHHHPHKLLQEKPLPGIGAFYPSMLDASLRHYPDHILWALTDAGDLVTIDTYIDAQETHNEANYYLAGYGKFLGYQHEIYYTLDDR